MLSSSLTIKRDPENPCPGPGICRLKLIFEPLKAVRSKVDLLITRGSGGRWRFDLQLVASQPDVDDVIKIEVCWHDIHMATVAHIKLTFCLSGHRVTSIESAAYPLPLPTSSIARHVSLPTSRRTRRPNSLYHPHRGCLNHTVVKAQSLSYPSLLPSMANSTRAS